MNITVLLKSTFVFLIFCFPALSSTISIADATTPNEKPFLQTVVVFMSSAQASKINVEYETFDGTATKGKDYTPVMGTLTFEPGETVKSISIPILDDGIAEEKETIIVKLTSTKFGNLADDEALVFITDDD